MLKKYNRIRIILAEKEIKNKFLADKLNISVTTVSRWVGNKQQPSLPQLFRIAEILGVKAKDLIEG